MKQTASGLMTIAAVAFLAAATIPVPDISGAARLGETPGVALPQEAEFQDLPKAGKKCWIGDDFYFVYGFDKKPKMGMSILKVELFDKDGEQITDWKIHGRSDMPSMRGAHDSGEVAFKQNRQGAYLLPVNIVMPGDWEVLLTFSKDEKVAYRGRVAFDV